MSINPAAPKPQASRYKAVIFDVRQTSQNSNTSPLLHCDGIHR